MTQYLRRVILGSKVLLFVVEILEATEMDQNGLLRENSRSRGRVH